MNAAYKTTQEWVRFLPETLFFIMEKIITKYEKIMKPRKSGVAVFSTSDGMVALTTEGILEVVGDNYPEDGCFFIKIQFDILNGSEGNDSLVVKKYCFNTLEESMEAFDSIMTAMVLFRGDDLDEEVPDS